MGHCALPANRRARSDAAVFLEKIRGKMWKNVERRVKNGARAPGRDACRHIHRKLQFAGKNEEVLVGVRRWN
jgi:hypothetical protein